jgi:hypothetical protein
MQTPDTEPHNTYSLVFLSTCQILGWNPIHLVWVLPKEGVTEAPTTDSFYSVTNMERDAS